MTRYWMLVLMMVVFVVGSGCDSGLSAMEEGPVSSNARLGMGGVTTDAFTEVKLEDGTNVTCSRMECEEEEENGGESEATAIVSTGVVEAVGADYIRVLGIDYGIVAQTVLVDLQDQPVLLADIAPGTLVKVEAVRLPDDTWEARYVVVAGVTESEAESEPAENESNDAGVAGTDDNGNQEAGDDKREGGDDCTTSNCWTYSDGSTGGGTDDCSEVGCREDGGGTAIGGNDGGVKRESEGK